MGLVSGPAIAQPGTGRGRGWTQPTALARPRRIETLTLPHRLGGIEEGALHVPQEPIQLASGVMTWYKLVGEGSGMAQINQKCHLLRGEADQVFVVVVGYFHGRQQRHQVVLSQSAGAGAGG